MNNQQRIIVSAAIIAGFSTAQAAAHPLSREECAEGSDFIKNAALSRENGMDGITFLSQTIADLAAIKSFPPALRWFVQDENDEDYLPRAVAKVFSNPAELQAHQRDFLGECVTRSTSSE